MEDLIWIDPEDGLRGGIPEPRTGIQYVSSREVAEMAFAAGRRDVLHADLITVTLPDELLPEGVRLSE